MEAPGPSDCEIRYELFTFRSIADRKAGKFFAKARNHAVPILLCMADALELLTGNEEQTRDLGERIGRSLQRGDVVLLSGDLGTGKTCLTQGIGRGLDCRGNVNSPSYVLMNEYPGREMLFHADLYRIEDVEELDDLGLWDYAERGVLVIEWPERGTDLLPGDGVVVELRYGDGERQRRLRLLAHGQRGEAIIEALRTA